MSAAKVARKPTVESPLESMLREACPTTPGVAWLRLELKVPGDIDMPCMPPGFAMWKYSNAITTAVGFDKELPLDPGTTLHVVDHSKSCGVEVTPIMSVGVGHMHGLYLVEAELTATDDYKGAYHARRWVNPWQWLDDACPARCGGDARNRH